MCTTDLIQDELSQDLIIQTYGYYLVTEMKKMTDLGFAHVVVGKIGKIEKLPLFLQIWPSYDFTELVYH